MKHRHVVGTKRERRPSKRTHAQAGQLGAQIAAELAGKTPEQLMALAERMLQPKGERMDTGNLYIRQCSYDPNSYSVFEAGRLNQFGEPYCHLAALSKQEASLAVRAGKFAIESGMWVLPIQTDQCS